MAWKRTGWVTEKPGVYELVDYACDKCGQRIGIEPHIVEDRDLLRKMLKTASCKCSRKRLT